MYDEESDKETWITQSRYSKTACAINFYDLVSFEDETHSLTAAELPKDDACKAVTYINSFDLAERIKYIIPKATRNSTDWAVGVWQEWAKHERQICPYSC